MVLAQMMVKLGLSSDGFDRGIDDAEKKVDSLDKAATNAGSKGGAFKHIVAGASAVAGGNLIGGIIGQVTSLASGWVEMNQQAENVRTSLAGLLGPGRDVNAFMQQLQDFSAATPFEFPELAQSTKMLMGFGFASKDVIPMLTAVGDAAGAMGLQSEDMNAMIDAMGQIKAQGKAGAEEMARFSDRGINAWEMVGKSLGKTVPEVRKMSEQGKLLATDVLPALTAGMESSFGGSMQKASETMTGKMSTLSDNVGQAVMKITGPLYEVMKAWIGFTGELASSKEFQNAAAVIGGFIATGLTPLANIIKQSMGLIQGFITTIRGSKDAMVFLGAALATILVPALLGVAAASVTAEGGFIATKIAAMQSAAGIAVSFAPVIAIAAVVAGAALLLYKAWEGNLGGIQDRVRSFVSGVIDRWNSFKASVVDTATSIWNAIKVLITGDFQGGIFGLSEDDPWIDALFTARETVIAFAATVQEKFKQIGTFVSALVSFFTGPSSLLSSLTLARTAVDLFGESAAGPILDFASRLRSGFDSISRFITGTFLPVLNSLKQYILSVVQTGDYLNDWIMDLPAPLRVAAGIVGAFVANVMELGRAVATAFGQLTSGDWRGALGTIGQALFTVLENTKNLGQFIGPILIEIGRTIATKVVEWGQAFVAAIPGWLNQAKQLGSAVLGWIGAQVSPWASAALGWSRAFQDWIGPVASAIPGKLLTFGSAVLGWIGEQVGTWGLAALRWGKGFLDWIGPLIPPFLSEIGRIGLAALSWIADFAIKIGSGLLTWAGSFLGWIGPLVPRFLVEVARIGLAILTWIGEQETKLATALLVWSARFIAWIAPMIPPFLVEAAKIGVAILGWIADQAEPLAKTLLLWVGKFLSWVGPLIPPFLIEIAKIGATLIGWIVGAVAVIAANLLLWSAKFLAWVVPMIPPFLVEVAKIGFALIGWILGAVPVIVKNLAIWSAKFLAWIATDVLPKLPGALGAILSSIGTWLMGTAVPWAGKELAKLGTAIIDGIKAGIASAWGSVTGFLQDKLNGLKNLLPSWGGSSGGGTGAGPGLAGFLAASGLQGAAYDPAHGGFDARRTVNGKDVQHNGIDLALAAGTPIKAPFGGQVLKSFFSPDFGNIVQVLFDNGVQMYFGHLKDRLIEAGKRLNPGQLLGTVGSTGKYSNGPHVHLQTWLQGALVDPIKLFEQMFSGGAGDPSAIAGKGGANLHSMAADLRGGRGGFTAIAGSASEMPKAAATFNDAAQAAISLVSSGVDALKKLTGFKAIQESTVNDFGTSLGLIIAKLLEVAGRFKLDAVDAGAKILDAAGQMIGIISGAVDALAKLQNYQGLAPNLLDWFGADLRALIAKLLDVALQFSVESTATGATVMEAVEKMIAPVTEALDVIAALRQYQGIGPGLLDWFGSDMRDVIRKLVDVASQFQEDGLRAAVQFSQASLDIFAAIKAAVETIVLLRDYQGITPEVFGKFKDDWENAFRMIGAIVAFVPEMVERSKAWRVGMETVRDHVKAGLSALGEIEGTEVGKIAFDGGVNVGKQIEAGANQALDIHSPSGVGESIARNFIRGVLLGLDAGGPLIAEAVGKIFDVTGILGGLGNAAADMVKSGLLESTITPQAFEGLTGTLGAQQKFSNYMQAQLKLLEMIDTYGLNAQDILGGVQLGGLADPAAIMGAMTRAQQLILNRLSFDLAERTKLPNANVDTTRVGRATNITNNFNNTMVLGRDPVAARELAEILAPELKRQIGI